MKPMLDRDEQARACHRLMSSVIITAIRDGCATPPKRSRLKGEEDGFPMSIDSFTAMRFLFDKNVAGLAEYLAWFDIDPGQYRMRLLETMSNNSALRVNGFEPLDRRNFRYNYGMWLRLKDRDDVGKLETENEDD